MWDGFCVRSRKASESVPEGTVRMTDTELAQKTPTDVHGVGENQYEIMVYTFPVSNFLQNMKNRFFKESTKKHKTTKTPDHSSSFAILNRILPMSAAAYGDVILNADQFRLSLSRNRREGSRRTGWGAVHHRRGDSLSEKSRHKHRPQEAAPAPGYVCSSPLGRRDHPS